MVFYSIIFLKNVWHSALPYGRTIIYLTNLILLDIFTVINHAEANALYYSPMLNFLKENCWSILTNNLPKPSLQFMCPPAKSNNTGDLNGRSTLGFVTSFSLQQL